MTDSTSVNIVAGSSSRRGSAKGAFRAYIDGAARGNPGPAGIGLVIESSDGAPVLEMSIFIGHRTNNQAEYEALIRTLKEARRLGIERLEVQTDSELLYHQLKGGYRVRDPELKRLHYRVQLLKRGLKELELRRISRKENRTADRLARAAAGAG